MKNKQTSTKLKDERTDMTRRKFIGTSLAAATAFTVVPSSVLGGHGKKSPSDKLNIAGVGLGGRSTNNLSNVESENIVALCDVDKRYAAEVFKKYPRAKVWTDFRKMLENQKDIDAVIITTPDHLHAVITKTAMEMGKHVYTEKPLTRTVKESRILRKTAEETGVATQMGNQGHSGDIGDVRRLKEYVQDGAIGDVKEVHCWTGSAAGKWPQGIGRPLSSRAVPSYLDWNLWLGPAFERPYHPIYHPNRWRGWWAFGNGALGDMGCHVMDGPFYALDLDYPVTVEGDYAALGSREGSFTMGGGFTMKIQIEGEPFPLQTSCSGPNAETAPVASRIRYRFPASNNRPGLWMTWWDGGLTPPVPQELDMDELPDTGNLLIGDKGIILCGKYAADIRLFPKSRREEYNPPPKTIPRIEVNHAHDWIRACKGGRSACSNFEYAAKLNETVLLGNVALRTGKKIKWDAGQMKATNTPEAERYVKVNSRKGWEL